LENIGKEESDILRRAYVSCQLFLIALQLIIDMFESISASDVGSASPEEMFWTCYWPNPRLDFLELTCHGPVHAKASANQGANLLRFVWPRDRPTITGKVGLRNVEDKGLSFKNSSNFNGVSIAMQYSVEMTFEPSNQTPAMRTKCQKDEHNATHQYEDHKFERNVRNKPQDRQAKFRRDARTESKYESTSV
jgi:hypothetical protein